jgi:hypothetical protein
MIASIERGMSDWVIEQWNFSVKYQFPILLLLFPLDLESSE